MKKITLATVKKFIRENRETLLIRCESNFDGMVDCVMQNRDAAFSPAQTDERNPSHSLGVAGAWFVGSSRDYFSAYEAEGLRGIHVSNCCGSFTLAIKAE